ncbi:nucleotide-binding protein [Humibacter albus]|uniref:TIR domain-containing protein n=1 Tax=Humibacter albus TaxID=427754 RepID=UPI00146AD071
MSTNPPTVFIGSSSEGRSIAYALSAALAREGCEPTVWDQGVFGASTYTLPSLIRQASRTDFAVLIATPDDMAVRRGTQDPVARDNVILEFGLFVGAIGLERVYILRTAESIRFPSDIAGLTFLPYHPRVHDQNLSAAVGPATVEVMKQTREHGRRSSSSSARGVLEAEGEAASLRRELNVLEANSRAQGWRVRTNSDTTLRLDSPRGSRHTFSFSMTAPHQGRIDLRVFASELRGGGLRLNSTIRRPPT